MVLFCSAVVAQERVLPGLDEPLKPVPQGTEPGEEVDNDSPAEPPAAPVTPQPQQEEKAAPAAASMVGPTAPVVNDDREAIYRNWKMRRVGAVFLGVGFGLSVTGVMLAEFEYIGWWTPMTMITLGVGLGNLLTGMLLMGLTRPHHGPRPVLAVAPGAGKRSAGVQLGVYSEF